MPMPDSPPTTGQIVADPTRPYKAYAAAVAGAVVAVGTTLTAALADGHMTPQEWIALVLAAVAGSGLTGGATYATTNPITTKR